MELQHHLLILQSNALMMAVSAVFFVTLNLSYSGVHMLAMCDLYRLGGASVYELLGKMVNNHIDLSTTCCCWYPRLSYSNYGGVSVKAEYCHESVSFVICSMADLLMNSTGFASSTTYYLNFRRSIRSIYSTSAIFVNWFLRPSIHPSIKFSPRSQKAGQVNLYRKI